MGRTIEIYIDDMVVKSKIEARHIDDLQGGIRSVSLTQAVPKRKQMRLWGKSW